MKRDLTHADFDYLREMKCRIDALKEQEHELFREVAVLLRMDPEDDEDVYEAGDIFNYIKIEYGLIELGVEAVAGQKIADDRQPASSS